MGGVGDPNWCMQTDVCWDSRKSRGSVDPERSSCQELGFGMYEIHALYFYSEGKRNDKDI